jgi:hypothetical protein
MPSGSFRSLFSQLGVISDALIIQNGGSILRIWRHIPFSDEPSTRLNAKGSKCTAINGALLGSRTRLAVVNKENLLEARRQFVSVEAKAEIFADL